MTEPLYEDRVGVSGAVRVRVPAKINLYLGVGPLRADGYHELTTVYQAVSLYDEVSARRGDQLTLTMEGEGTGALALDGSNLVLRAARALAEHAGVPARARLHLRKQIPIAAGLAGGSADAAAALVACDGLWGTGYSREELARLAARVGSDVPFLVLGGTALGTGRGEAVSPVLARGLAWHWVLAVADDGLSTPAVYRELDRLRAARGVAELAQRAAASAAEEAAACAAEKDDEDEDDDRAPLDRLLAALRQRDPAVLAAALGNELEPAALSLRPDLADTLAAGRAAGALAGLVSGSGPTCVFLVRTAAAAACLAEELGASGTCRAALAVHGGVAGARVT